MTVLAKVLAVGPVLLLLAVMFSTMAKCSERHTSRVAGGRMAFTQKAFDEISKSVIRILEEEVRTIVFAEASGAADMYIAEVYYHLYSIDLQDVSLSTMDITIVNQKVGLRISAVGHCAVNAKYAYHTGNSVVNISDSGSLRVDIQEFEFTMHVKIGSIPRNMMFNRGNCGFKLHTNVTGDSSLHIPLLHVTLTGEGSNVYKYLPLDKIVKTELENQVHEHIKKSFHRKGLLFKAFNNAKTSCSDNGWMCHDIGLAQEDPVYEHKAFVDLFFDNTHYLCKFPKGLSPCMDRSCPPLPQLPDTPDRMIYEGFNSDYFHTTMLAFQRMGYLTIHFKKTANPSFLDLSISNFTALAKYNPQELTVTVDGDSTHFSIGNEVVIMSMPIAAQLLQNGTLHNIRGLEMNLTLHPKMNRNLSLTESHFTMILVPINASLHRLDSNQASNVDSDINRFRAALIEDLKNTTALLLQHAPEFLSSFAIDSIKTNDMQEANAMLTVFPDYIELKYDFRIVI